MQYQCMELGATPTTRTTLGTMDILRGGTTHRGDTRHTLGGIIVLDTLHTTITIRGGVHIATQAMVLVTGMDMDGITHIFHALHTTMVE